MLIQMEGVKILLQITKVNLPSSQIRTKSPYSLSPDGVCVHNTYNDASAMAEISYMQSNNNYTSFHFAVDDYRAVQGLKLNKNGWHSGDGSGTKSGNRTKIAIEICYSKSGGTRFTKAEQNGALLTAILLKHYGWGIDRVSKHQDYSGKYCPHRTLNLGWKRFLNMVQKELDKPNKVTTTAPDVGAGSSYLATVTTASLNIRQGCSIAYPVVGVIRDKGIYTIIEEKNNFGKLKSGAGWISLDYVRKIV